MDSCIRRITLKQTVQALALIKLVVTVLVGVFEVIKLASEVPIVIIHAAQLNDSINSTDIGNTSDIIKNHLANNWAYVIVSWLSGFGVCCSIWLAWTLWKGATKESRPKLIRWWWVTLLLIAAVLVPTMITLFMETETTLEFMDAMELVLDLCTLLVVRFFISSIPIGKKKNATQRAEDEENLTEFEEVQGMSNLRL